MTRRHRSATILIVAGLLGGVWQGCDKPQRPLLSNLLVQPDTAAEMNYRIAWAGNLGLPKGQKLIFAEMLGDRLVVLESGNIFAVINTQSGKVMWRNRVGQPFERFSRPRRDGDRLILCSETRAHIYEMDIGGLLNVITLAETSNTSPLILNGNMILGSPTGVVFAQDLAGGLVQWTYQTGGAIAASPIPAGSTYVTTSTNGKVFAFNPNNGVPLWNNHTWGRISAPSASSSEMAYVASEDRSLYAFSLTRGNVAWRFHTEQPLSRQPLVFGSNVYQHVPKEGLVALDAATGKKKWTLPWHDAVPIMLRGNKLHLWRVGKIVTVTPDDGLLLQTTDIAAVHFVLRDSADALYCIRFDGHVLKLIPK